MENSNTTTVRLHYDLSDLREFRANRWQRLGSWLQISVADDAGNRFTITTTGEGEGKFSKDCRHQYVGTCDFSLRGWSDARARRELRRLYHNMMDSRRLEEEYSDIE